MKSPPGQAAGSGSLPTRCSPEHHQQQRARPAGEEGDGSITAKPAGPPRATTTVR
ncbi:MAG TPA: hypothetical protein VHV09_06940 [Trebonia sp.]|nr:hypothetical protein [Trebonia sp.]